MTEKAVVRAMQLFELLADSDVPLGVSELSRQLDWTKSGTHRLLTTFIELGYAQQLQPSMTYRLSHKIVQLASKSVRRLDLRQASLHFLRRLLELTGETARLSIRSGDHAVCIEQIESSHPVTVQTQVGGTLLLGCSSTGKAILAFQDETTILRIARSMVAFNERTLAAPEKLVKDLELSRRRGFAINQGEQHLSVSGVAAPVRDRHGRVEAAIGVSGPSDRLSVELLHRYGTAIKEAADELSGQMGWSGALTQLATDVTSSDTHRKVKAKVPV